MIKPIETEYNGYRFRSRLEARWAVFFDALGIKYEYEPEGYTLEDGTKYLPDFRIKCYGTRGGFVECNPLRICVGCEHRNKNVESDSDMASWFDGFCDYCDFDYYQNLDWIKIRGGDHSEILECQRRKQENDNPFDLWIEVKGNMTQNDADKIKKFSREGNAVLIVGNIPEENCGCVDYHNYERMNGIDIYPWNYETIDGDHFGAFPAVHNGHFYLDGDDSSYQTMDYKTIAEAFRKARYARFEHGEKG